MTVKDECDKLDFFCKESLSHGWWLPGKGKGNSSNILFEWFTTSLGLGKGKPHIKLSRNDRNALAEFWVRVQKTQKSKQHAGVIQLCNTSWLINWKDLRPRLSLNLLGLHWDGEWYCWDPGPRFQKGIMYTVEISVHRTLHISHWTYNLN